MSSGISHTNDGDVGFHLKTFGKGMWLLFTVFGNINYHCANINFTKTKKKKTPGPFYDLGNDSSRHLAIYKKQK